MTGYKEAEKRRRLRCCLTWVDNFYEANSIPEVITGLGTACAEKDTRELCQNNSSNYILGMGLSIIVIFFLLLIYIFYNNT